jgi:CHAP domain
LVVEKDSDPGPYGYTSGPLFNDGPGFTNASRAESLASAENSGFCQDMVMANTDFSWLWPDINYVARWPRDAQSNGRSVTSYPIVGSVVVFRPGNHYWSSTHYWNYGDGHVAMVVKVDSASYTVAEFNFNLGGGGRYIMDGLPADLAGSPAVRSGGAAGRAKIHERHPPSPRRRRDD